MLTSLQIKVSSEILIQSLICLKTISIRSSSLWNSLSSVVFIIFHLPKVFYDVIYDSYSLNNK